MPDTLINVYGDGTRQASIQTAGSSLAPYYYGEICSVKIQNYEEKMGFFVPTGFGSVTLGIAIGDRYISPSRGQWRLGTGAASSPPINWNATTADIKNAVSLLLGDVTVTSYGSTSMSGYIITAATINTALTLAGESLSLTPYSTVEIINLTSAGSAVTAQKVVRLRRSPYLQKTLLSSETSYDGPQRLVTTGSQSIEFKYNTTSVPFHSQTYHSVEISVSGSATYSFNFQVNTVPSNDSRRGTQVAGTKAAVANYYPDYYDGGVGGSYSYVAPGIYRNVFGVTTKSPVVYATTSAGGFFTAISAPYTSATNYKAYLGDVADYSVYATDTGLLANFKSLISGTSVTVNVTTLYTTGGGYDLGVVTFMNAALDEAFVEKKSNAIGVTLEVTVETATKKLTLAQLPVTILRNIA